MQHKTSIFWELENIFIGLFSICLAFLTIVALQSDEKSILDVSVDGIQSLSYPPSIVAGTKLVTYTNRPG